MSILGKERRKSKWQLTIDAEVEQHQKKDALEKAARAARLAKLFDDSASEIDDEDRLDAGVVESELNNVLGRIDTHLNVEKQILEAWDAQDKEE